MSKLVALMLFALLVLSSLVMVEAAFAQVEPEFTVKLVAHPYDVPTTYSTDPYTGETITHEGYHVENKSIEVWIKNQPFTSYTDEEGHEVNLYYNVQVKGHFEEGWIGPSTYLEIDSAQRVPQSNSEYSVLSLLNDYQPNAQVDYRVKAVIGYTHLVPAGPYFDTKTQFEIIEESGWSEIQTLIIEEFQTPSPEPFPVSLVIASVIPVAVVLVGLGLLVYRIKRK